MSSDKCLDYNVHMCKRTDGGHHGDHYDKGNDKTHNSNFGEKQMHIEIGRSRMTNDLFIVSTKAGDELCQNTTCMSSRSNQRLFNSVMS